MQRTTAGALGILAALCLAMAGGCETSYQSITLRPVDTTSQFLLQGVRVSVARDGAQPVESGVTSEHGQVTLQNLRAGDVLTLSKAGYEPAVLELGVSSYVQRSPALATGGGGGGKGEAARFELVDVDAIPVPLHRVGSVVRP